MRAVYAICLGALVGAGVVVARRWVRAAASTSSPAAPDVPPFFDYRHQRPGASHEITVADLPPPREAESIDNGAHMVPRPADAWPSAPVGFEVDLYADGLDNPRLIRTAPNGDLFVAESEPGQIRVLRGLAAGGRAAQRERFATGLNKPFGLAFYPPGKDPQWLYVGDTDAVVRFPYRNGDLHARGPFEKVAELPGGGRLRGGGHWTRDLAFSLDGQTLFASVGSRSNVDDPDLHPAEFHRADILAFDSGGGHERVFAWGIRNAVGIAVHPTSGELWASVNERDRLGDNLVPDYITHVEPGGFYGWPWYYIGGHPDPRLGGRRPELAAKVIVPDVLLQPHDASLQMTFYGGQQFPADYRGDIFAAEHGSWNRHRRSGYEVVRVPMHGRARASGGYQDFLTGFVTANGDVWGRPVGVEVAADGALMVSDDGTNSIWRVSHVGGK
ncbi:MAG TPA: PQQ-dependent sugar dehydrogenase [Polyangia bacterium]|jgi:glucose/arabinose dehydrogenase